MSRDGLRFFKSAAIEQVGGDAGRTEGMAVRRRAQFGFCAAPLHHPADIDARHAIIADAALFRHRAPQRLTSITNANGEYMPLTIDAAGDVTKILWQTAGLTTKREHDATFDPAGRKLTDVGGMGQTTTYAHDSPGNLTSIQTPLTWSTGQTPDALNRIATICGLLLALLPRSLWP
jgi:hypothetical protein